eukprot:CAMPEP_0198206246 /NCGR_PEP_ID=MMETSP1445-20131203/9780_1 /TAXON_ID=36898 /ORGANISM="Pyramimonas sp., Strain CCMP2087" /LENGTH=435 /DNA_ID=CAMNT_0043878865 /DNA_START=328 /DNA_END=1635 /DNA_ORIENTATION=+
MAMQTVGVRQIAVVLLCFAMTFIAYVDRVGFSIAYTKMSDSVGTQQSHKGAVLSAFYWGYATSQIPCAWLAAKYGGVRMLTISMLLSTVVAALTPDDPEQKAMLSLARIMVGIAQGAIFPSIHNELGKWKDVVGPKYFSTVVSLITSGMYLGSAGAMFLLPKVAVWGGPSMVFKLQACLGVLWTIGWNVANTGLQQTLGSDLEKGHAIAKDLPPSEAAVKVAPEEPVKPTAIPWLRLLSTAPVWAIVINNFCFHYIVYVLMAWLPTYFEKALKMDMSQAAFMNQLPYLVMFVFSNVGGIIADRLIGRMGVPVGTTRKMLNTTGFVGAALVLMLLPYLHDGTSGVLAISAVLGFAAIARGGFALNHLDVAPAYAGSVMSVANTAGTFAGIVGVGLTGVLLNASGGEAWSSVFGLLAAICAVGATVFIAFATGERLF